MERKTKIAAAAGAVAVAGLLAWAYTPAPVAVETAAVSQGRFETTIDEDGKTRLRDRYVVSAPLAGRLDRIALREGDAVDAGAVVATLTPAMPPMLDERTRREQEQRVAAADANVQRAAARGDGSKVALEQARIELRRSEQLAAQGFIAPTKLDNDRLAVQAAQNEVRAALEEGRAARHDAAQARAALDAAYRARAGGPAFAVRAPVPARVLRVLQPSEATVALGAPLLELGDTAQMDVVAELLTTDAVQAPPLARVLIEGWGGEGALEGRVRRVEPGAFTKVSALGVEEQRVRVLIDIVSPPERWQSLGDGYRVAVRIVTRSVDDAVRVPVGAVFPRPGAGMAVFVVEGGRARLKAVDVAARNGVDAWVRSGVAPGQTVVVYPSSAVHDGVRVRLRAV